MPITTIRITDEDFEQRVAGVWERLRGGVTAGGEQADVPGVVREIIAQVRQGGDQALLELTAKYDKVELEPFDLQVNPDDIEAAHTDADPEFLELVRRVIRNIREYQEHIMVRPPEPLEVAGRRLGVRYTPVRRVGVYVPGGRALYPSTVLMTVVPAQVAGVEEIAIVSPPTTGGNIHPLVLALAGELGIEEVYRIGGAQAVAALAAGTETIAPVDKIVGPGNAFVAEAKRQVLGMVGIDSVAGPSEVLIIADDTAAPACVAADMIAQAEHDPGSAVLVTTSPILAEVVTAEIERQLNGLKRRDAVERSMREFGAIVIVNNFEEATTIANQFATEHLQIVTADNDRVLSTLQNAGAIFLGPDTPVPLGDYVAGPSHVLPTGGTARFFSALSCNDFLKASSVIEYNRHALVEDGPDVIDFATREGLTGHANAIRARGV